MKKQVLAGILSIILVMSSSTVVFAGESIDGEQIIAEHQAAVVEEIVGTEDVCTNIEETRKDFVVEGESLAVDIPKDGDEDIVMESEDGEEIAMGLPEEAEDAEAVVTDDGTIVYDTNEDVSVAVQAVSEEQGGETFEAVRTMVTIENNNAPKEYTFDFDLPQGYLLTIDTDYSDEFDEFDCGSVYILDDKKEVINTIEEPWAIDANGNDVETYYRIEGNVLIQVVEFDEDSAFPIVADPTSHPNKYTYAYFSEVELLKMRDKYTSAPTVTGVLKGIGQMGAGVAGYKAASIVCQTAGVIGTAWGLIDFCGYVYNFTQYNTWNKIYKKAKEKNKIAEVRFTWRYHPGKRCYRPSGQLKVDYVKRKPANVMYI